MGNEVVVIEWGRVGGRRMRMVKTVKRSWVYGMAGCVVVQSRMCVRGSAWGCLERG